MNDQIQLRLPRNAKYITVLRITSASVSNGMKFSLDSIEDIKMCVGEAMILGIKDENKEDNFVEFFINVDKLVIKFGPFSRKPDLDSMSMQIIRSLMDDVGFENGFIKIVKKIEDK